MAKGASRKQINNPWRSLLFKAGALTVSEWADKHRMLDPRHSAEPGLWCTSRTPYLREVMDAFCDPGVSQITLLKSARVGGSEAMYNMALYAADVCPGPALVVLPTEDGVRDEFKGRLRETIEACPRLVEHIPPQNGRWATESEINLDSMRFYAAYAAAPVTLTRRTCRYVFFDELDNCEKEAGRLGSHLGLASERTTTYGYRGKTVSATTPTYESAAGWQAWEASDQRRYHVPCPHCGHYQVLTFAGIRVPEGMRDAEAIEADRLAWYRCAGCDGKIAESHRAEMVARGVWVPKGVTIAGPMPNDAPDDYVPAMTGERPRTRRVGFHIWSAYSPWRTWSEIMAKFMRVKDNPEELRVFVNAWLGEPWREAANKVDVGDLRPKMVGALPMDVVPKEANALIMAVDVQLNWCWYVIRAWGPQARSWLIREGSAPTLDAAYKIAMRAFPKEGGGSLAPAWMMIDTGYRTIEVYDFARTHPGVVPVKGQPGGNFAMRPSRIEYTPEGTARRDTIVLWQVNTWRYKEWIMHAMRVPDGEPGYWGLNANTSDDYLEHITSEQQVWSTTRRGKLRRRELVWQTKREGAPNHSLDCEVYLTAQAEMNGLLTLAEAAQAPSEASADNPRMEHRGPSHGFGRRPMGFRQGRYKSQ